MFGGSGASQSSILPLKKIYEIVRISNLVSRNIRHGTRFKESLPRTTADSAVMATAEMNNNGRKIGPRRNRFLGDWVGLVYEFTTLLTSPNKFATEMKSCLQDRAWETLDLIMSYGFPHLPLLVNLTTSNGDC